MKYEIKNALGQSPTWLTPDELEQAQILIDLGFHYCGDSTKFVTFEDCDYPPDASVCKWKFKSSEGELGIDAICRKALFFKEITLDSTREDFETEIKAITKALRAVIKKQNSRFEQLSLEV